MERCIVCLNSNEDILSRITTISTEWAKKKIKKIIEKHLWWWYLKTTSDSNKFVPWICRQCWEEISAFHDFYRKVEKAHRYYQPVASLLGQVKEEKQEIIHAEPEHFQVLDANLDFFLDNDKLNIKKQDNNEETLIDIQEMTDEHGLSNYECSLGEENVLLNISDENSSNNDLKLENVEHFISEYNKTENMSLKRIKLRRKRTQKSNVCKNKKTKNATQCSTLQKERLKCETNHVDTFFKENQHSLECSICNVPLQDFRSIRAHYRNEHSTRGYALCCGKKFYKRCLLVDHLKVHKDPNFFQCESCTKAFKTRRGLEMHIDTHKIRERKYNCDECGKSYFNLNIFQRHKLTHVPDVEKKFNCPQCDKKFASDDLRRRHEDSIHARKNAKVCHVCGKSFSFAFSFLRHMDEHAGITQAMVTCDICGVKLTNKYGLRQHIKMRHMEENLQEQICPHCSRVSPNLNAHRKHIKYTHTMQRNHACHLCEKAFRRPLELKEHLSTHTGEALYTCPHCPRTFISNANMHKHRKIIHRREWEEGRLKKMNKTRGKSTLISINTVNDKEAVQNGEEISSLITDPFINSFALYLENKDN